MKAAEAANTVEKTSGILLKKIEKVLKSSGKDPSRENIWAAALDVLEASIQKNGEYLHETLWLLNRYIPNTLEDQAVKMLELLQKCAVLTQNQIWMQKDSEKNESETDPEKSVSRGFLALVIRGLCSQAAYEHTECVDGLVDCSAYVTPKIRKKIASVLQRVIRYEHSERESKRTFQRIFRITDAHISAENDQAQKMLVLLAMLAQEISVLGEAPSVLLAAAKIQRKKKDQCAAAISLAAALLAEDPDQDLDVHKEILCDALEKPEHAPDLFECTLEYASQIFRAWRRPAVISAGKKTDMEEYEGSCMELALSAYLKNEVSHHAPEKIPDSSCKAINNLIRSLKQKIFPSYKKVVTAVAHYCLEAKDMRMSKEIELVIGYVGPEKFLKCVREGSFSFWLPMLKAAVHSTELSVFCDKIMPRIYESRKQRDREQEHLALWSCFPSFCRKATDKKRRICGLLEQFGSFLQNPGHREHIALGVHTLVEEARNFLSGNFAVAPEDPEKNEEAAAEKGDFIFAVGRSTFFIEQMLQHTRKDPTESEKLCIRSLLSVADADWLSGYLRDVVSQSFAEHIESHAQGMRPEHDRKETDVPEPEKVFIENALVFEMLAPSLKGCKQLEEGVLKYCVSTRLRTQKAGYRVMLGMVRGGYCPPALADFFLHKNTETVMFSCSRFLRLQVLHEVLRILGKDEGVGLCRLIYEMSKTVKIEGGKNRKVAYDIAAEMAVRFAEDKLGEAFKMALAGIPKSTSEYQSGVISILSTFLFNAKEKVPVDVLDMVVITLDELTSVKVYSTSKAALGFFSVLLMDTPHTDRYLSRVIGCADRIATCYKMKLHENLKVLLRKTLEKRKESKELLTYQLKQLLNHRPQNRTREDDRVFTNPEGKLAIRAPQPPQQKKSSRSKVKRPRRG